MVPGAAGQGHRIEGPGALALALAGIRQASSGSAELPAQGSSHGDRGVGASDGNRVLCSLEGFSNDLSLRETDNKQPSNGLEQVVWMLNFSSN